ncbi:hypothetical protein MMPV_008586 [Pyropia vietnamensis]
MAFTVAFHPGAPLLLGGHHPVRTAAAATGRHLPGPRSSRPGRMPSRGPAVRMAAAPGGGGSGNDGSGVGDSGDEVNARGVRKPRGDPEWMEMAKQVGGADGDSGVADRVRSFWPFGRGKAAAKAEENDDDTRPAPKWVVPEGYGEEALGGGAPEESSAWQLWSGALDREADAPPPQPRDGKAEVDFWRSSAREVTPSVEDAPAAGGDPSVTSSPLPPPPPPPSPPSPPPPPPPAASADAGTGVTPSRSGIADATPPDDPAGLWGMARAVTGEVAELQERLQEEVTSYDLSSSATAYRDFARGVYEANRGEDASPPPPPAVAESRGWASSEGDATGDVTTQPPSFGGGAGGFADVIYTDSSGRVLSAAEVEEAFSTGAVFVDDDGNEVPPENLLPGSSSAFGGAFGGASTRWNAPPPPSAEASSPTAPTAFEAKGLPPPSPPSRPRRPPSTSTYGGGWDGAEEALRELQAEGIPLRDPASETAFWRAAVKDIALPEPVAQDAPPAVGDVAASEDAAPPARPSAAPSSPLGGPSSGVPGWADFASSLDDAAVSPAGEPTSSSTVEAVSAEQMEMLEAAARVRGGGGAAAADNGTAATDADDDMDANIPTFEVSLDDDTFSALTSGISLDGGASEVTTSAPPPPAEAVTPPPPVGEEVSSAWDSWSSASSRWEEAVNAAPPRDPKAEVDQWRSAARDLTDTPAVDDSSTSFGGGGVTSDWGAGLDSDATSERARWGAWSSSSPLGSGDVVSGFGSTVWARPGQVSGRKRDKGAGAARPGDAPSSSTTWLDAARDLTSGRGAAAATPGGTTPADSAGADTGPAGGGFVFDPTAVSGRAPPGKGADIDQWRGAAQDVAVPPAEEGEEGMGGGRDATV